MHVRGEASRIALADQRLQQAFTAVLEAENAGANIFDLIAKLDEAGRLVAEARMGHDENESATKADQCSKIALEVLDEANTLKDLALVDRQNLLWQSLAFSLVGIAMFLTVLFSALSRFRRDFPKKLLKMKPEVTSDAEA
jgi:hypothetical protein